MKVFVTILTVITLLITGCGSKAGVKNSAQKSYLYFTGDTAGVIVSIDNGEEFFIKSGENNQYGLKPGKHLVKVKREGVLVIKREIYLGDGIAKEIEVGK